MGRSVFIVSGKSPINLPGGLGAYSINLANIFKGLGYVVYVLGFNQAAERVERDGIHFIHIKTPFDKLMGIGVGYISSYFVREIQREIDTSQLDRVIVYGVGSWGYVGYLLKKKFPQKEIKVLTSCFTTHSHELKGHIVGSPVADYGVFAALKYRLVYVLDYLFIRRYDKIAISHSDKIVLHYDSTRNIIDEDYGPLPNHKICKIPYCVELYKRVSEEQKDKDILSSKKKRPWVVVICRQDPRKGMNTFIKAVKILKDRDIVFDCYVVGSGPFLEDNKNLAKKLGLKNDIQFLGFVDDIQPFLLAADVYILPAVEEGSGAISLLEAMKLGVPIVTTICDGIPEDFTHERNALLVAMNDQKDMAFQIQRILEDQDLKESISRNARNDYAEKFTFKKMREAIAEVI